MASSVASFARSVLAAGLGGRSSSRGLVMPGATRIQARRPPFTKVQQSENCKEKYSWESLFD